MPARLLLPGRRVPPDSQTMTVVTFIARLVLAAVFAVAAARYLSSAQGRFSSPDKPLVDQYAAFPQSWNLYSYVRNNPLKYTDPHGEDCVYTSNQTDSSITVTVERGDGTKKDGKFVNGTIDANSFSYTGGSLDFGYTDAGGVASTHSLGLREPLSPGLMGLQRAGQIASPVTDPKVIAGFYAASAVVGYGLVASGAIGGGSLTTLAGEQGVGLMGNQAVN